MKGATKIPEHAGFPAGTEPAAAESVATRLGGAPACRDAASKLAYPMQSTDGHHEAPMTSKKSGTGGDGEGPAKAPDGEGLTPEVQDAIARQLRAVYGKMVSEPLPPRFETLLEQLKAKRPGESS